MSILDHPEARALLADAVVTPEAVGERLGRLDEFLGRYLPRFHRAEQRRTAALVLRGRLGGLERKTCEPIAIEADVPRKPVQFFVGAGKWDDESVMAEMRVHVVEELGDPAGVVVADGSGFARGEQSSIRLNGYSRATHSPFLPVQCQQGYVIFDAIVRPSISNGNGRRPSRDLAT